MAQAHNAAPITNRAVPIEFPNNPDAMLDDHMVPFKERGLRGKAGSAPPLDLDRGSRGLIRMAGRMASLSVGHTGSTLNKKKEAKVSSCAGICLISEILVPDCVHGVDFDGRLVEAARESPAYGCRGGAAET